MPGEKIRKSWIALTLDEVQVIKVTVCMITLEDNYQECLITVGKLMALW